MPTESISILPHKALYVNVKCRVIFLKAKYFDNYDKNGK